MVDWLIDWLIYWLSDWFINLPLCQVTGEPATEDMIDWLTDWLIYLPYARLLENQLQKTEKDLKEKTSSYESELTDLRRENERQNKLIQQVRGTYLFVF